MIEYTISNVRDIFQIVFFITISTITVLTYLKAKRTLLQPIKTEIFKEQIKIFADILNFFRGKKEWDLMNEMYLQKLINVNLISLMDDYGYAYFKIDFDRNVRPYNLSECFNTVVLFKYVERLISPNDVLLPVILNVKKSALKKEQFEYAKRFVKLQGANLATIKKTCA